MRRRYPSGFRSVPSECCEEWVKLVDGGNRVCSGGAL